MARTRFINPLFTRTEETPPDAAEPPSKPPEPTPIAGKGQPASTVRAAAAPGGSQTIAAKATAPTSAAVDDEPAVKFTFYFSPAQLRQLDDLWVRAKVEHGQKISKSEFVRVAVARLLEEFDKNPDKVLKLLKRGR